MIRLAKVELRRFFSRRLTIIGLLGALVVTGLLLFAVAQDAKPLPAEQQRAMRADFERAQKDWEVNGEKILAQCRADEAQQRQTDPKANFQCDQMRPPTWDTWGKPEVRFTEALPDYLLALSYLVAFAAFLIGAGFIGAEFSSGSIGNWLTFEPRRLRVYASKLVSVAIGAVPAAVVLTGLMVVGAWVIIDHYGTTAGMTGDRWADFAGVGGRAVALASAAGVLGAVIGLLLRHTAAALGLAAAYMVLIEGIFSGLLEKQRQWMVVVNVDSWVKHGTMYPLNNCVTDPSGNYSCNSVEKTLSFGHSAAYLGIALAVLIVLGAMVFRRRDIT
jgi:ABC-2 type transport system permease protein